MCRAAAPHLKATGDAAIVNISSVGAMRAGGSSMAYTASKGALNNLTLSMARALRGQSQPTHDFFYWEFHERGFQQAVRMGPWKAVRASKDAALELYDLHGDPRERSNVAPAHQDVVKKIEAEGIKLDEPVRKNEAAGVMLTYITDPWGTRIELVQRPPSP
jgi:hypothetical protein